MVNRTVLVGRLTRDPELRKTQSGKSVLSFTLAVTRQFNRDETDFIRCQAWKHTADFIANYLNKGSLISVEGCIQTGSYEDSSGKKIYTQDVVAERVQALESRAQREGTLQPEYERPNDEPTLDITSDDLPF